ncbi:MAG: bifunctional (p)ppGpp synthetase/guanosine-3',5'-bis(diphosphate) 3'-pyrophosphohydrolase [Clostridia bacterium]|nr:bifunctional (p)ppGpp synthetase/guanosine-3',5'-bis(diphosphate) 3'-pyrophosphohydrolase [Clostridia bacterium]
MYDDLISEFLNTPRESDVRYNIDRIRDAAIFAAESHHGQLRKSGEPYLVHPLEVAKILISYGMDEACIIASLLHDVIEDTATTKAELAQRFSPEIAELVDGVTKLGRINYTSKEEQQVENLRKMLLAMAKDIRVIMIKLADRLHNMRTLEYQTEDKKRSKAMETLEVYAPLAHRLGIQNLKSELEDIALKYIDPIGYDEIVNDLEVFHESNERFIRIKQIITDTLDREGIQATIESRIKHIYSIYRKMFNQNKDFDEIYDLYAFRIIVDKTTECYNVLGLMHDQFSAIPGRLKDYIATPKPNMYQSLHTTVSFEGYLFEIQIRTQEMHKIAELGIAAHWKYKTGHFGKDPLDEQLAWVRKLLEVQSDVSDADDFLKTFKIDLFADQVFVSTPKGDIITLHADSTVIDFAYAIHTQVGNKMIGAKINGRIVELTSKMQNGDVVEILTSDSSAGPSRDWLNLVKTNEAKAKIRQWFKKEKREENILQGRADLEREMKRSLINLANVDEAQLFAPILDRYNLETISDLHAAIGYGGVSISKILPKLKVDYGKMIRKQTEQPVQPTLPNRRKPVGGVVVDDIDNCLVRLAGCCVPVPGDEIVGFITRGNGVTVHQTNCPHLKGIDAGRLVKVHWEDAENEYFNTTLTVDALNRIDLMADISSALAQMHIMTRGLSMQQIANGDVRVVLNIEVHSLSHLEIVAKRLRKIKDVLKVERA